MAAVILPSAARWNGWRSRTRLPSRPIATMMGRAFRADGLRPSKRCARFRHRRASRSPATPGSLVSRRGAEPTDSCAFIGPRQCLRAEPRCARRFGTAGRKPRALLIACALRIRRQPAGNPERGWQPGPNGPRCYAFARRASRRLVRWHTAEERPGLGASAPLQLADRSCRTPACQEQHIRRRRMNGSCSRRRRVAARSSCMCSCCSSRASALMKLGPQPPSEILSVTWRMAQPPRAACCRAAVANVGWSHATGDLLDCRCTTRATDSVGSDKVLRALAAFAHLDQDEPCAQLSFNAGSWKLEHVATPSRRSLQPRRWCRSARYGLAPHRSFWTAFRTMEDVVEERPDSRRRHAAISVTRAGRDRAAQAFRRQSGPSAYPARRSSARRTGAFLRVQSSRAAASPRGASLRPAC